MTDKIVVLTTCSSDEEAARVARHLVERRLAACVNLVSGVRSVYHWQGKIDESGEVLLVIKSSRALLPELKEALAAAHSYEVPEVIALPVVDGSAAYLAWMERELKPAG